MKHCWISSLFCNCITASYILPIQWKVQIKPTSWNMHVAMHKHIIVCQDWRENEKIRIVSGCGMSRKPTVCIWKRWWEKWRQLFLLCVCAELSGQHGGRALWTLRAWLLWSGARFPWRLQTLRLSTLQSWEQVNFPNLNHPAESHCGPSPLDNQLDGKWVEWMTVLKLSPVFVN